MPLHDYPLAHFRPPIVLVVENRPAQRSATGRLVSALGYEVRAARSGELALEAIGRHPALFDLVLTNILLPDMDGGEFVDRVRLEDPAIRLAWIADYAAIGKAAALTAAHPDVPVVRKPFGFRELRETLVSALGPPHPVMALPGSLRNSRRPVRRVIRG